MRANSPIPAPLIALALAAALMSPGRPLFADTQAKREKHAKQEAKNHQPPSRPAAHSAVHPEAQAKRREAEAKKRRADDRRHEKRQESKAKRRQANPVSSRSKRGKAIGHLAQVASTSAPHRGARKQEELATGQNDAATGETEAATRVHAWVRSSPDADPDLPEAAQANPAIPESVAGTIRGVPDAQRPQLPPVDELAVEPMILPALYTRRGHLVMPPPLKGSHEILLRQNQVANDEGLDRVRDDDDLDRLRGDGALVAIRTGNTLRVDERLPLNRRYCRPWTALFLATLARQHFARFGSAIQVNSAVRTVEFQQRLIHTNGNAAPAEGDTASPHLTGQAVDIAKRGLTLPEVAWLRAYLLPLVQQGKVDVEEEFQQSCFHISVYKTYLPPVLARRNLATARSENLGALGMGLR